MTDSTNSLLALRAQQPADINHLNATFDYASLKPDERCFFSGGTPRPLNKLQLLVRQPTFTRRQQQPSNFILWLCKQRPGIFEATTVPLLTLLTMLDADHAEGARFIAVCKPSKREKHVLTVLDVPAKKFYRASSPTGILSYLKGVAKRRAAVKLLDSIEAFLG